MKHNIVLLMVLLLAGCKSVSSTIAEPHGAAWLTTDEIRGVPVKFKVPTHVRVNIYEVHLLGMHNNNSTPEVLALPGRPLHSVETELIESEKTFFVDAVRPGAGQLNLTMDINPDTQFFKQITNASTDRTLLDSAGLLQAIAPSAFGAGLIGKENVNDGDTSQGFSARIQQNKHLVATEVFSLDDPNLDSYVMGFLDTHLNCEYDCKKSE